MPIAGVDAAKPLFAKTKAEGLEVQKPMDALVAELNTVAATTSCSRRVPSRGDYRLPLQLGTRISLPFPAEGRAVRVLGTSHGALGTARPTILRGPVL